MIKSFIEIQREQEPQNFPLTQKVYKMDGFADVSLSSRNKANLVSMDQTAQIFVDAKA